MHQGLLTWYAFSRTWWPERQSSNWEQSACASMDRTHADEEKLKDLKLDLGLSWFQSQNKNDEPVKYDCLQNCEIPITWTDVLRHLQPKSWFWFLTHPAQNPACSKWATSLSKIAQLNYSCIQILSREFVQKNHSKQVQHYLKLNLDRIYIIKITKCRFLISHLQQSRGIRWHQFCKD